MQTNLQRRDKKILVVDDDPAYRELLAFALEGAGYEVLLAENGAKGLNLAAREKPDAILVDLIMPVMDGIRFLKALRNDVGSRAPAIVVTCDARRSSAIDATVAGATDVLLKPVDPGALEERIESALGAVRDALA